MIFFKYIYIYIDNDSNSVNPLAFGWVWAFNVWSWVFFFCGLACHWKPFPRKNHRSSCLGLDGSMFNWRIIITKDNVWVCSSWSACRDEIVRITNCHVFVVSHWVTLWSQSQYSCVERWRFGSPQVSWKKPKKLWIFKRRQRQRRWSCTSRRRWGMFNVAECWLRPGTWHILYTNVLVRSTRFL